VFNQTPSRIALAIRRGVPIVPGAYARGQQYDSSHRREIDAAGHVAPVGDPRKDSASRRLLRPGWLPGSHDTAK
jgi:hypothetical protein